MLLALAILIALSPNYGLALSLGTMTTKSALNAPFLAEIALNSITDADRRNLRVSLAPMAVFNRAGIDRPFLLTKLRFRITKTTKGKDVIRITSRLPVREPYLIFFLEANWSKGNIIKKYTTFLDPASPVQLPETPTQQAITQSPSKSSTTPPAKTVPVYGPVKSGATLSKIAQAIKAKRTKTRQVVKALYRHNPHAFVRGNKNRLKRGVTLRLPESKVSLLKPRDASSNLSANRMVANTPPPNSPANTSPNPLVNTSANSSTNTSTNVPADTPASPEINKLREALQQAQKDAADLQSKVTDLENKLQTKDQELQQHSEAFQNAQSQANAENTSQEIEKLRLKVTELEAQLQTKNQTIADQNEQLQQAQTQLAQQSSATKTQATNNQLPASVQTSTNAQQSATNTQRSTNNKKPTRSEKTTPSEEDIFTSLFNMLPTMNISSNDTIIGGVLLVLLLAGLIGGSLWLKKRRSDVENAEVVIYPNEDSEHSESTFETQTLQQQDLNKDTSNLTDFPSNLEDMQENTGEVDPAQEADLYIAYGRYQQAETLITQTLDKYPDWFDLKLKLLEIYFTTRNVAAFSSLVENMDAPNLANTNPQAWTRICVMGQELLPGNALFADIPSDGQTEPKTAQKYSQTNIEETDSGLDSNDTILSEMPIEFEQQVNIASKMDSIVSKNPALSDIHPEESQATITAEPASDSKTIDPMFESIFEQMDDLSNISPMENMLDELNTDNIDTDNMDSNVIDISNDIASEQLPTDPTPSNTESQTAVDSISEFDLDNLDIDLNLDLASSYEEDLTNLSNEQNINNEDFVDKLALARNYMDNGFPEDMTKDILEEVINGGNQAQQNEARELLTQLG